MSDFVELNYQQFLSHFVDKWSPQVSEDDIERMIHDYEGHDYEEIKYDQYDIDIIDRAIDRSLYSHYLVSIRRYNLNGEPEVMGITDDEDKARLCADREAEGLVKSGDYKVVSKLDEFDQVEKNRVYSITVQSVGDEMRFNVQIEVIRVKEL